MKKVIYPCLWFDGEAHEAAEFYCSIFEDCNITSTNPIVTTFEMNGTKFMALNGGPHYKFNEAVSFVVDCDTQEEIDRYWNRLTEEGTEGQCGWLKDKYGVSWQIVPTILGKLMSDQDKAPRVMKVFMQMKKFNIDQLMNA